MSESQKIQPKMVIIAHMQVVPKVIFITREVITPNLGNYQADMTISPTAINQSKLLEYFQ